MEEAFVDCVYNTLIGVLDDAYCIPDVKNEFATGMPCEKMYEDVYNSYQKICEKYGINFDIDVEKIIDSMSQIGRELGYKMYEYGAKFGLQEKPPADTIL